MLISEELIALDLKVSSKEETIYRLAEMALKDGKITDIGTYAQSVFDREKLYTTGVGNGIAIPHGKSKSVKEAMIVFGKLTEAIDWNSLDGGLVNIVFLLGVPEENTDNMHLKILSQLSRKLVNEQKFRS